MSDFAQLSDRCRTAAEWQARVVATDGVILTDEATRQALRLASDLMDRASEALDAAIALLAGHSLPAHVKGHVIARVHSGRPLT